MNPRGVATEVQEWPSLVAGEFRKSGRRMEIRSPYDGSVVGAVFEPADQDVEDAVVAAQSAFRETSRLPSYRRAEILHAISAGVAQRREEFIRLMALEAGKPRKAGAVEVDRAVYNLRNAAEEVQRIGHELLPLDVMPSTAGRWGLVRRFPIGPVLAITPFNFPLNLVAHKVAPAIAAGNTVVLKPAPQAPLCSMLLAEIVHQTGVVAGGLNVLPGSLSQAERLVADERLKMLTFTGSTAVGWKLKSMAGKKRVLLELGGNAGVIVHKDADLDLAAARCAAGGFSYAGQTCISVQRILVERSAFQPFLDRLSERVRALRIGDPLEETTDVGPMISGEHVQRIADWVEEAVKSGAKVIVGGRKQGATYEPTILTDTKPAMKVNCLEVFAPVVTVEAYDSFDAALDVVNDSPYGLQAGVFTNDNRLLFRAFEKLQVGGIMANDVSAFRADHMPYGGSKESGRGREGARYAIEEMTEPRILVLNTGT